MSIAQRPPTQMLVKMKLNLFKKEFMIL